jgi:hypothetical protein
MKKTNFLVTASAVCFALTGAFITDIHARSAAVLYIAGHTSTDACVPASETVEARCSINNTGGSGEGFS